MAFTCSPLATSAVNGRADDPIEAATFAAASPLMSATSTWAPSATKLLAMAAPNPEPPPVTMIFLFSRRICLFLPDQSRTTDGSAVFDDDGFGDTELAHGFEALFTAMTG